MRLSDLVRDQAPDPREDATGRRPALSSLLFDTKDSLGENVSSLREADAHVAWYGAARKEITAIGEAVRANRGVTFDRCHRLAEDLVTMLATSDDLILRMMREDVEAYQVSNAIHVAILSVKIGQGLRYDSAALERLALAGLLHDLGMWLVPQEIVEKSGSLNADEWSGIHAHPEQGRRVVAEMGESFHWLATAIAQEHERWDGSGYPCRLKGGAIVEVAQIIGLADVLDAMMSPRPYHARVAPHQALRSLLVQYKQAFQPRLIKTLVDQLSLYPIGTSVRLNDGHIGIVSKVNSRYPLRPVLLVQRNREGQTNGEAAAVDLCRETSMHIVEVLPETRAA
ncbi:MAG: HD domain-containing protein [Nitrospira sp.]|nr:HD domain-containing protein [Nitrospira sp.]